MKTALDMDRKYAEPTDPYELNIRNAARKMIYADRWYWTYVTQYASGSTVWRSGEDSVIVKAVEGEIA